VFNALRFAAPALTGGSASKQAALFAPPRCGGWAPSLGTEREPADFVAPQDGVDAGIDAVELRCGRTQRCDAS